MSVNNLLVRIKVVVVEIAISVIFVVFVYEETIHAVHFLVR